MTMKMKNKKLNKFNRTSKILLKDKNSCKSKLSNSIKRFKNLKKK